MSPRKSKHQRAAEAAAEFNKKHPQGTPVHFWPGDRLEAPLTSRTRGEAWVLPSGDAVVRVQGRAGGVSLSHIEVIAVAAGHSHAAVHGILRIPTTSTAAPTI